MSSSNFKAVSLLLIPLFVFLVGVGVHAEDIPPLPTSSEISEPETIPSPPVKDDTTKNPTPGENVTSDIPSPFAPGVAPDPVLPVTDYNKLSYDKLVEINTSLSSANIAICVFVYLIIPFVGSFYVIKHFILYPFKHFVS